MLKDYSINATGNTCLHSIWADKMNESICIVDESVSHNTAIETGTAAIVLCMYYDDSLSLYGKYIDDIPCEVDLFIISSKKSILDASNRMLAQRENTTYILKENRGRDISALLVAFGSERFNHYKYVCFVHDKKPKSDRIKEDSELWSRNLWENTIASRAYIMNCIQLLEDEKTGLLVPPKNIGSHLNGWYSDSWGIGFEPSVSLADELGLNVVISRDKDVVSTGTCFWCRTEALEKLWTREWKYSDFQEEPIPEDGLINHAVERLLSFIAMDAGYETKIIMTKDYAQVLLGITRKILYDTYKYLEKKEAVYGISQIRGAEAENKLIEQLYAECNAVYLYGAGYYGEMYYNRLRKVGYQISGFIVSNGKKAESYYLDVPVYEISEIEDRNIGIIITMGSRLQTEVAPVLEKLGFRHVLIAETW